MFEKRTPEIEKSVKDHDMGCAVKEYLKNNKLEYKESDINKMMTLV